MLKTKLGLYHAELRNKPKNSPKRVTLTLVETQQFPDFEKVDSKYEVSFSKRTIDNGRRKVFINFQTFNEVLQIPLPQTYI